MLAHDRDATSWRLSSFLVNAENWQAEIADQRVHPELGELGRPDGRLLACEHRGRPTAPSAIDAFESFEQLRLRPFHETVACVAEARSTSCSGSRSCGRGGASSMATTP